MKRDINKEKKKENVFINTTPHAVTFLCEDGTEFTVEPCGVLINARAVEEWAGDTWTATGEKVMLVRTRFVPDPESERVLRGLEDVEPKPIIFGSIISAQAFPGRVLGLVAAPGFERVPVAEKRMRPDKFTVF